MYKQKVVLIVLPRCVGSSFTRARSTHGDPHRQPQMLSHPFGLLLVKTVNKLELEGKEHRDAEGAWVG